MVCCGLTAVHSVLSGEGLGGRESGALLHPLAFPHQSHAYGHKDTSDEGREVQGAQVQAEVTHNTPMQDPPA